MKCSFPKQPFFFSQVDLCCWTGPPAWWGGSHWPASFLPYRHGSPGPIGPGSRGGGAQAQGKGITDPRRFSCTVTALLYRLDQVHGAEALKLKVRIWRTCTPSPAAVPYGTYLFMQVKFPETLRLMVSTFALVFLWIRDVMCYNMSCYLHNLILAKFSFFCRKIICSRWETWGWPKSSLVQSQTVVNAPHPWQPRWCPSVYLNFSIFPMPQNCRSLYTVQDFIQAV